MAILFPGTLDTLSNPTGGDYLSTTGVVHHVQHADANDAIEALEAKVGVDSSAVTTSLDYIIKNTSGGHHHDGSDSRLTASGNPTASVGLSAVNGSATTWMRSDGAPALSQSIVPTWTGLHTFKADNIVTTLTDRIVLSNTTASTSGVNLQISPALHFIAHGWSSDAGGSDVTSDARIYLVPAAGAGTQQSLLTVAFPITLGSATYVTRATLDSAGTLTASGGLNVGSASGAGTGEIFLSGDLIRGSNAALNFRLRYVTVANNGVAQLLSSASQSAYVWIAAEGTFAQYICYGGSNLTAEVSDPDGLFSTVAGTGSRTNIYWSAGNARYEIENKRGSSNNYKIWYFSDT